ncbi:hypothetical protein [Corallococcus sp. CA041A]|uniref:hypothetical protein n=1 Tax=Corallococcus sp. CA041A TaxID=2316727 RepID=UPI0011C3FA43|nr:hypothetical protein [Corallococcus sp. CA041A]
MSNYYNDATAALARMKAVADEISTMIKAIEPPIQATIASNLMASQKGTTNWIQWTSLISFRAKHEEWGRKIHGIIMGYSREMESAYKHINKARPIEFTHADVTVGTNEPFAKAIQFKHTVSTENSAVDDMIAKAANQLTGESGEKPLATQRKIIDVMINDNRNWWPFTDKELATIDPEFKIEEGFIQFEKLKVRCAERIRTQLSRYRKNNSGINRATANSLYNHPPSTPPLDMKRSAHGQKTTMLNNPLNQKLELLTIKMVYGHPRKFRNGTGVIAISKIVFVAHLENGKLAVKYLQHS